MKEMKFYAYDGACLADISENPGKQGTEGLLLLKANTTDAAVEKHVPVYRLQGGTLTVTVGSTAHPMLPEHYIEWIFVHTSKGGSYRRLSPQDAPQAEFRVEQGSELLGVYAFCNLHGLWRAAAMPDEFHETVCSAEFGNSCIG